MGGKLANIVVCEQCNLHCPYCFASSSLNQKLMQPEDFNKIIGFLKNDSSVESVGLIGGEPLIHPLIGQYIDTLFMSGIAHVNLFTNGFFLNKIIELIRKYPHLKILINLNSPEDIGNAVYEQIVGNIDDIVCLGLKKQISIGANLYKPNQNLDFVYDILRKYSFSNVRYSVAVPSNIEMNRKKYFSMMKGLALEVFEKTIDIGITPRYDCNAIPQCIWTDSERETLNELHYDCSIYMRNIFNTKSVCHPVVDIFPDLTAIRCFGCSDLLRVDIKNFASLKHLQDFFVKNIDSVLLKNSEECQSCPKYIKDCYGGCLKFRRV